MSAALAHQVAETLHDAHERGTVHRDMKPANLLVDPQGTAWVTDFGLAQVAESDLTRRDEVLGTLREVCLGDLPSGRRLTGEPFCIQSCPSPFHCRA